MKRGVGFVLIALWSSLTWAELKVEVEQAWIRMPLPGKSMTAAYMVLRNAGEQPVTLTGAQWPGAKKIELHTMSMEGGVMRMRPIEDGITVPAGGKHEFKPGGDHFMVFGLKPHAAMQDAVIALEFSGGHRLEIAFPWRQPGDVNSHSGMHH